MKSIVAGQHPANEDEFAELAWGVDEVLSWGVDEALFTGMPGESALACQARMDAALAVLADLRREDPELAAYAERLLSEAPVSLHIARRTAARRSPQLGVAA